MGYFSVLQSKLISNIRWEKKKNGGELDVYAMKIRFTIENWKSNILRLGTIKEELLLVIKKVLFFDNMKEKCFSKRKSSLKLKNHIRTIEIPYRELDFEEVNGTDSAKKTKITC